MNRWKLILWLVMVSPVIVISIWGFRTTAWMQNFTTFGTTTGAGDASAEEIPAIPISPFAWFSNKSDLNKAFDQDALNDARSVTYTANIAFGDLLHADESPPEDVYIPLYATARAPQYMNRFCPEVLNTIGTRCIVASTSAGVQKDGSIQLVSDLYYTPDYETGAAKDDGGAALHMATASLATRSSSGKHPANNAANRADYIEQAKLLCEKIKAKYGNCVIKNIRFVVRPLQAGSTQPLPKGTVPEIILTKVHVRISVFTNVKKRAVTEYVSGLTKR